MNPKTSIVIGFVLAYFIGMAVGTATAGSYIEVGAGYNRNLTGCTDCWNDAGAGPLGAYMRFGKEWHLAGNVSIGGHWIHLSQWLEGPPFSDEPESSVDHLGIYIRYDF